jgi:membrane-associated phospholipid phosphatase
MSDESIAKWVHDHTTPGIISMMRMVTLLGSPMIVITLAVFATLLLYLHGRRQAAIMVSACVYGGVLLNTGLKNFVDRARPHFEPSLANAVGYSFPSGHVAAATLLYGCLAVIAARELPDLRGRICAPLVAAGLIACVSLSRIYLGVHFLTDVLAAQAVGLAWLGVSLWVVDTWARRGVLPNDPANREGTE